MQPGIYLYNMATIPTGQKFHTVPSNVQTVERGSALANSQREIYTMQDIVDTTRPYKVFTALLTQSGGDDELELVDGDAVTKGVTYLIDVAGQDTDFSNVGGPKYEGSGLNGTYFIATIDGIPNNYGGAVLLYNTGAPVATVLENTIGNVWFTYEGVGGYKVQSNSLFTANKSTFNILNIENTDLTVSMLWMNFLGITENDALLQTFIFNVDGGWNGGDYINGSLQDTPIEIRVYN